MKLIFRLIPLVGLCFSLSGCIALLPAAGMYGANASGVGSADEQKILELTAKNFAVDPSQVKISNIKKDSAAMSGSEINYDVALTSDGKTKSLHCMMTSSFWANSSPLCAKPGESVTSGSAESCNALLHAAGKC